MRQKVDVRQRDISFPYGSSDRQALISALPKMLKTIDFSSATLSGSNFKILSRFANRCPLIMKDAFHASVRALLKFQGGRGTPSEVRKLVVDG